nr:MAG TPA: hypothetical protein [Caudoviricetes sp.]
MRAALFLVLYIGIYEIFLKTCFITYKNKCLNIWTH